MAKIKGWLAKYNQIGSDNKFMPGCFKENDMRKVPVVDDINASTRKEIGTAELFLRDEGLYCEADVDLNKVNFEPKSFEFLGRPVERGDIWNQIKSVKVRLVSLSDVASTQASDVEEIEK